MKLKEQSLALCYAIEAAGASESLTKCSVLASELHAEAKRLAELADRMKRFAAANWAPFSPPCAIGKTGSKASKAAQTA